MEHPPPPLNPLLEGCTGSYLNGVSGLFQLLGLVIPGCSSHLRFVLCNSILLKHQL